MPKKITLNELAIIIKSGFDDVDKRLENLDQGQNALKNEIEELKLKLTNVVYRFEYDELSRRIVLLERKLSKKVNGR